MTTTSSDLLDKLLQRARASVAAKEKSKVKSQTAARDRLAEVGDLEWPVEDPRHWTPFACLHMYERQICTCCGGEQMTFHQELVGFHAVHSLTTIKWIRNRGEAFDRDLPHRAEVLETRVPRCWSCYALDAKVESLWRHLSHG